MHPRRHIVANLLLAVLIYGGLFAPLHHSIYMALGGFHQMEGMADDHANDEPCHEVVVPGAEKHLPVVTAPEMPHPECPFMELFTISLLSYEPSASSTSISSYDAIQSNGYPAFYWQDTTHPSYSLRGPPQV